MLRATTPYTFSTSQRPKVLRDRQFLTLFTSLCVYLCIFSSFKFPLHLSFHLPLDLSINLSSRHVDNKTMLLDFCWQHQKRSNSARLSHFLQLKTSKTKQFCETSFKNGKLTVQLTASYQCVFAIFPCHVSKVLRLPRKSLTNARWNLSWVLLQKLIVRESKSWDFQ